MRFEARQWLPELAEQQLSHSYCRTPLPQRRRRQRTCERRVLRARQERVSVYRSCGSIVVILQHYCEYYCFK